MIYWKPKILKKKLAYMYKSEEKSDDWSYGIPFKRMQKETIIVNKILLTINIV